MPSTRVGGATSMLWMNTSSGSASSAACPSAARAARFQVVSSVNTTPPITSGNQPPSSILSEFDARNARSISAAAWIASGPAGQFHRRRITTKMRIESISIASVTAMPYDAREVVRLAERHDAAARPRRTASS